MLPIEHGAELDEAQGAEMDEKGLDEVRSHSPLISSLIPHPTAPLFPFPFSLFPITGIDATAERSASRFS